MRNENKCHKIKSNEHNAEEQFHMNEEDLERTKIFSYWGCTLTLSGNSHFHKAGEYGFYTLLLVYNLDCDISNVLCFQFSGG